MEMKMGGSLGSHQLKQKKKKTRTFVSLYFHENPFFSNSSVSLPTRVELLAQDLCCSFKGLCLISFSRFTREWGRWLRTVVAFLRFCV